MLNVGLKAQQVKNAVICFTIVFENYAKKHKKENNKQIEKKLW
jgi:hypothetical protein